MRVKQPSRGEIWLLDLDPTRGREQAGRRPALVISDDRFNHGPAELAVILPITSKDKGIALHVAVSPPEGGLKVRSFVKCEDIRSVSLSRFGSRFGSVSPDTMRLVEDHLRMLLGF